jgi:hypothetical protein
MQRSAANVREWEHLEHPAIHDLFDDFVRRDSGQRVEHRLPPRAHLLGFSTRQVAQILAADGVQGTEHHDLAVLPAFEHRFEAGAEGQRRLPGARTASHRDDADVGVEKKVDRDALFGAAAMQAEHIPITSHELDALVGGDSSQCTA